MFKQYVGSAFTGSSRATFNRKKWAGSTSSSLSLYYCDIYPSGFNHISAITWHGGGCCGYMFDQNTYSGYLWGTVGGDSGISWGINNGGAYIFANTHIRYPISSSNTQTWFWVYGY